VTVKVTDRVWYDENPGIVTELVGERRALVEWDHEHVSECDRSDLVKMTDYEANTAFTLSHEQPVGWYDGLPTWVKGSYSNDKQMRQLQASKWTRSTTGADVFYQYTSEGAYVRQWSRE
jgi:hypothetical protein